MDIERGARAGVDVAPKSRGFRDAVPHKRWTERPLAVVVLRNDDEPVSEQEFRELLLKDFPSYHLPGHYIFAKEIPKTSVGKFDWNNHANWFCVNFGGSRQNAVSPVSEMYRENRTVKWRKFA